MMGLFEEKSVSPMLIAQMQEPFNDDGWIYELKLDGCRCIGYFGQNGTCLQAAIPAGAGNESAVWVHPDRVCTVEYMPNTKNSLRQAVFKGFRTDVVPEDVD